MKKLFIALPVYKEIEPECRQTIDAFTYAQNPVYKVVDFCIRRGSPNIYWQRYNLAKDFLKSDADYYLYFDGDQTLSEPQADIIRLIDADKDIISPIIVRKVFPHIPTCRTFEEIKRSKEGKPFFPQDLSKYGKKPFPVYHSCGGVVLIKREVIEAVEKPFFPRFDENGDLMGTDCSFFADARDKGFTCWVEPNILCGHVGKYIFTKFDFYGILPDLVVKHGKDDQIEYELKRRG